MRPIGRLVLVICALVIAAAAAADDELTLEKLFPEKGLFGPAATRTSFSHDGSQAAYLYRPYPERRHGSDLWILDVESGVTRRVTSVNVLAEHLESARKVREDREKKRKKAAKGQAENGESETETGAGPIDPGDPISGTWKGMLRGGVSIGLARRGLPVTLTLRRRDGAVSGSLGWFLGRMTITTGTFDEKTGALECSLRGSGTSPTASLSAELEKDRLEGTMTLKGEDVELDFKLRRQDPADPDQAQDQAQEAQGRAQDQVGADDADDEKAPRYGGIGNYVWAPHANELIFTAGGDLFRYAVEDGSIVRLTRTAGAERDVQYLPDGSGYTYRRENALMRVSFGGHLVEQLDPALEGGERVTGYRLSPDGRRLVVVATKGESQWARGRKVNIVSYRDRFAQVRQVTRHMPDDPPGTLEWSIYLYDLGEHLAEKGPLLKVHTHKQSGPRDVVRVPRWSPDSSRVAWSVFEQSSGHVEILEARFLDDKEAAVPEENQEQDDDQEEPEPEPEPEPENKPGDEKPKIESARALYRLLHNGGPTTPSMIEPRYLPDSRRLVFMTELSGFRHLHVLDPTYEQLTQLTTGRFEVYPVDQTRDHTRLFCTATEGDPAQRHVFAVGLDDGTFERLSRTEGFYDTVAVSPGGEHVLANLSDFGRPKELVSFESGAEDVVALTDSHPEAARKLTEPVPEYFTFENRHGQAIHGHLFRPEGWSADEARPLLIYVYGGPLGTQKMIRRGSFSGASYFFAYYMAKKHGYVTCTIDPRGASGFGGLFEKANYEQVGRPQVEDLVDTAKWFVEHQGVDAKRIGLHGWSFGGFQTQMCLYTEPDVFACGIAGAGPTEWENYNSWYSTGTIGPSREGETDLEKFSLLPLAKNLKAKLLLVHGMEDSNVLYQDTVRVYRELLKAGKETEVELFLDPTGGHGLGGDVKALNRYRKYEDFLLRCLGRHVPEPAEGPS